MVKRVGDYLQEKTLGEGTFGKVKSAINTKTHEKVAMKIISLEKIQKHKMQTQITREISIMKSLKHKHVVELKDVLQSKNNIYMIMELCTGGELFDKIATFAPPPAHSHFDEELARRYFQQLIAGVRYCHSKGVAHRDLKPENLLLDEEGNLKISDFGLSASLQGREVLSTACGTPNYVAPEVLLHRGYDGRMADIWSCGVVLYVMLAGYLPFEEPTESVLYEKIKRAQHRGYPPWFSPAVRVFLDKILVPDPHKRMTIEQMEKDPWFAVGYQPETIVATAEPSHDEAAIGQVGDEIAEQKAAGAPDIAASGLDVFTLISMLDTLSINPMLEHRGTGSVKRRTCFITAGDTAKTYAAALSTLAEQRITITGHNQESLKILADTPRVRFGIQIYTLTPTNTLVEILRRRGDTLDFVRIYQAVSDAITKKCKA